MDEIKRLYEQQRNLYEAMKSVVDKAATEKREMSAEDEQEWQRMNTEISKIEKQIEVSKRMEDLQAREADNRQPATTPLQPGDSRSQEIEAKRHAAFTAYLRQGERLPIEQRATLQVDSDTGGGYLAASETWINQLLVGMANTVALRRLARIIPCRYEESLGVPTLDSDVSAFTFGAGELTAASEDTSLAFGQRELKPRALNRKLIKISRRLVESPRVDIAGIVNQRVQIARGYAEEQAFMTGAGAVEPLGLFTASNDGVGTARDVSTTSATGFGSTDDLVDVVSALKPGYLGNAKWLLHRDCLAKIRKLKDGIGQMIWQPGLTAGEPMRILNFPYVLSDYVPNTFTTKLYIGMFGDFSYYWIADAISMTVQVMTETYAITGQVGYLFDKMAVDGMPVMGEAFARIKTA